MRGNPTDPGETRTSTPRIGGWSETMVLRVGVLGLSHDHIWPNLKALAAGSVGRLVAVAEPDPALRARLADEQGSVETHEAYDDLLGRGNLDAIFVYADNRKSAE